jgi:UV excision repair protein RAD23
VTQLAALGFSKIEAAQAYIACDKNEELAANLLFDRLANGDIEQAFPGHQGPPGHDDEDDDNLFN